MQRYIAKRLIWLVFVLLGISLVTFVVSHMIPADPIRAAAGKNAGPEQVEALRRKFGMDKPLPEQYLIYLSNALQGDLGTSIRSRRPVLADLRQYFPATAELALAAFVATVVFGILIGSISALWQNSLVDHCMRVLSLLGLSMPAFWLGLLLQWLIYGSLGLLPAAGRIGQEVGPPQDITGLFVLDSLITGNWAALGSSLQHLFLPAFTLAVGSTAVIARTTRSSMLDVLSQDYVRTARGKGLGERVVVLEHALPNALISTITLLGLEAGYLLGGVFLVEVIYSWPGIGQYAVRSVIAVDFPAIMGVTLLVALVYVLSSLAVDLCYAAVDPRIRLGGAEQ